MPDQAPARTKTATDVKRPSMTMRPTVHLGEHLISTGAITPSQLQIALDVQQRQGGLLGSVLREQGIITERQFAEALSAVMGLPFIELTAAENRVQPAAVKAIPEPIARRNGLVGVKVSDGVLTVAMADPSDVVALDTVRTLTGLKVEPVVAPRGDVLTAIGLAYAGAAPRAEMHEVLRSLQQIEIAHDEANTPRATESELAAEAGQAPVVAYVDSILNEAANLGASDIHIEPQRHELRVRMRIDGELQVMPPPPHRLQDAIVSRIKIISNLDIAEHRLPQDGRLKIRMIGREIDVRVSTMPVVHGEKVVLRLLDQSGGSLHIEDLGFVPKDVKTLKRLVASPYGILLLCGPTGSGKTTTLYAFLQEVSTTGINVVTVEEPVEYELGGVNQTPVRPQIGLTFASTLRNILRQDPDVVMVGEIRDLETLEIAVRAALTGHLVFSTLHTNTAIAAVTRMVNLGLPPHMVSATLVAAISQRLVRRICPKCREEEAVTTERRKSIEHYFRGLPLDFPVFKGRGCERCRNTGFKGRSAAYELFEPSQRVREAINRGAPELELVRLAHEDGMQFLLDSAYEKVRSGVTSLGEVLGLGFHERGEEEHGEDFKRHK